MKTSNYRINDKAVTLERIEGEVVIISFSSGKFYSSKGTGADILSLYKNATSNSSIEAILKENYTEFDSENSGLEAFTKNLIALQIIIENTQQTAATYNLPNDLKRDSWVKPELHIHDEIHGLLLVDPIHDTNDQGWPKLKDDN